MVVDKVDLTVWQHAVFLCKDSAGAGAIFRILSAGRIQAKCWLSPVSMVLGTILCAMWELSIHIKKAYVICLSTSMTSSPVTPFFFFTLFQPRLPSFYSSTTPSTQISQSLWICWSRGGHSYHPFTWYDMFSNFLYVSAQGGSNSPQQKHCPSLLCSDSLLLRALALYHCMQSIYLCVFIYCFCPRLEYVQNVSVMGAKILIFVYCWLSGSWTVL